MFRGSLSTLALLVLTGLCFGEDAAFSPEQIKFFESKVRPLLAERCWKCHGEEKQSGELRLDHRGMAMTGGESGPAISLESPAESLLLEAVRYESLEMPPDGRLKDAEIAALATWLEMGAPWPGDDVVAMQRPQKEKISDEDREFWSFRPLHMPDVPQLDGDTWSRRDIDRFVLRKLREHELSPAEEADRRTLIRRLYFDLIGLPPSPEEVDAFLADQSPDAYEKLVDNLLGSPRFGEHWARFWLDLVRYADSDGFRKDDFRPDAWRYRDYVIQAFNEDKPFDKFVREQIAADEMYPEEPQKHVATGFLRHGMYEYNQRDAQTQWQDMLNDITDTTGDVFLGVGMGCARCHDHKFDPILQADYFRLQAFFVNISLQDETAAASAEGREAYATKLGDWEQQTAELRAKLAEMETPYLDELREAMVDKFPFEVQEIYRRPNDEKTAYDWQV
ncbi:MAG: DUF1549 domain-containing protein, partial [Planctomycetaceae bacterium]|nr:DUF1549 domain-containing protein [Planctomycetaceae bacterium]